MQGEAMKAYRDKRGQNQQEFAGWLNEQLSRRYDKAKVSRWESGSERIPRDVADLVTRSALTASAQPKHATTLAVANQKGGVGKTVTSINVAYALNQMGCRVLLIDADSQSNATVHVGFDKRTIVQLAQESRTLYHALLHDAAPSEVILNTSIPGLDLVASSVLLANADTELLTDTAADGIRALRRFVDEVRSQYDFVVMDCAPNLGMVTTSALTAADYVLIPTQTEPHSLMGLEHLLSTIAKLQRRSNRDLAVFGIVPTQYKSRNSQDRESLAEIESTWGKSFLIFDPIPATTQYPQAAGASVIQLAALPDIPGAATFRSIAQRLVAGQKAKEATHAA